MALTRTLLPRRLPALLWAWYSSTSLAKRLAAGAGMWLLLAGLLALIQFGSPAPVGVDGYYHLRMALLMRVQGWMPAFPWLPLTILSPASYYDHHFLFHLLLVPFAWGDPSSGGAAALALGGKIASLLLASLACMAVWIGLRRHVRWAWLWTLGLFALSAAFLYRMSMPRAQSVSLLLLVAAFFLLAERRDRWLHPRLHAGGMALRRHEAAWLIPLGFIYVWMYDAFPLLLLVAACRVAADLLSEGRLDLRPLLYAALGIGLGLLINPYFPRNLVFIAQHLLPKLGAPGIPVGNEWYPYDTWTLVTDSGPAFAALLAGIFFLGKGSGRPSRAVMMALLLALAFGLLFLQSRRFAEYFPPFSLIFLALAVSPWLESLGASRPGWGGRAPALLALLLLLPMGWIGWQARREVAGSTPLARYGAAAAWLGRHSVKGEMVFQTDWDDFPRLFFYDTVNAYTVGLDPTYLQLADAHLYEDWVAITRGEVQRPSGMIAARFGAGYVFSDLQHTAFIDQARADPGLQEVYRDRTAVIYRVLDKAGSQ